MLYNVARMYVIPTLESASCNTNLDQGNMIHEVWAIELGVAVGPFRLGASIADVLHALKVGLSPLHESWNPLLPPHGCD